MTVKRLNGIGYCARTGRVGDWAFHFALTLARRHGVRLNIFFFPTPPCNAHPSRGRRGQDAAMSEKEEIDLERSIRLYYDDRLGDYVNVGFRLCEGDEDPELRRCLLVRQDYDILVLAYEHYGCTFGRQRIESFAESMPCPTLLVGPEREDQVYHNSAASLWRHILGMKDDEWRSIDEAGIEADFRN
jgi:hypothetical protein